MTGFEQFLVVLDELQAEACDEYDQQEHAEQQSLAAIGFAFPV